MCTIKYDILRNWIVGFAKIKAQTIDINASIDMTATWAKLAPMALSLLKHVGGEGKIKKWF